MTPRRIQRQRTKGWKMPPTAVYVGRPTEWGNGFIVGIDGTREECIEMYRENVLKVILHVHGMAYFEPLRGKDLACWCHLCEKHKNGKPASVSCPNCEPCHADLLLALFEEGDINGDYCKVR